LDEWFRRGMGKEIKGENVTPSGFGEIEIATVYYSNISPRCWRGRLFGLKKSQRGAIIIATSYQQHKYNP